MHNKYSIIIQVILIKMGKHKKIINNDPILKKDYKYQKRKKERALQKEAQQQQRLKQQKAKQEIAQIENQVQQQIQNQILRNSIIPKNKKIYKLPKQLFCKRGNIDGDKVPLIENVNKESFQIKFCENGQVIDHYAQHYKQLPKRIKIMREYKQNKKQAIDRQVKQQIKSMFSAVGEKQDNNMMEDEEQKKPIKNKPIQLAPKLQGDNTNPYILLKQFIKQKQIVLNSKQINLFSNQAYITKQTLKSNLPNNSEMSQIDIRQTIIKSYKDYVHIENKQQETIEQYRKIVVTHMIQHEKRCRSQQTNTKGFTNCKSVILCPFFGDAKNIFQIFQAFYEGYEFMNKQKLQAVEDLNDFFRVGISVNDRKKTFTYFSGFNVSNFIVGSPVGLKAIVGSEGESQRDYSFLSSVQILYIDRASVIYMQNWDHLIEVVKSMNLMPSPENVCNDITKLRPSVPDLMGKLYRQTIIFSQFNFPQINGLKYSHLNNWQGCITTKIIYPPQPDSRSSPFDIQFYKMQLKQPKDDLEMRFDFFKKKFWDEIHNKDSFNKLVIFARSYFQYIRLKQFLIRVHASAEFISEHTKKPQVQRKISQFNSNKIRVLLLTQRAYYYSICQIKKVQHLYFYSLPRNSYIYSQLISQIFKQHNYIQNKVVAIYTKYDIMALERIVGTKKAMEMVKEYCSNVSFVL